MSFWTASDLSTCSRAWARGAYLFPCRHSLPDPGLDFPVGPLALAHLNVLIAWSRCSRPSPRPSSGSLCHTEIESFPFPKKERDKILRACKREPGPGFLTPPGRTEKEGYEQPLEPCGDTTVSQTKLGPPQRWHLQGAEAGHANPHHAGVSRSHLEKCK